MRVTHDERELRLRVSAMRWEAEGVISLELRDPDGTDLPAWEAGAHLDLVLPGVITRQYSLNGDPDERAVWRISVLREREGKGGSKAVHEQVRVGQLVDVVGPRNNFPLLPAEGYLFIAGGIGITPLLPMLREVRRNGAQARLVYGGRTRSSMAHLREVEQLCEEVLIAPQDEYGLLDLDAELATPEHGTLIYCCGPEGLLSAVQERARSWGPDTLHLERFAPKPNAGDGDDSATFQVVLDSSGEEITVQPGQSILQALEAEGFEHINSCREGICGTCETEVLDGIPDHRDSLLSEEERAANDTMMICVGRAKSARIVLDL